MVSIPPIDVWYKTADKDEAWVRHRDHMKVYFAMHEQIKELEEKLKNAQSIADAEPEGMISTSELNQTDAAPVSDVPLQHQLEYAKLIISELRTGRDIFEKRLISLIERIFGYSDCPYKIEDFKTEKDFECVIDFLDQIRFDSNELSICKAEAEIEQEESLREWIIGANQRMGETDE